MSAFSESVVEQAALAWLESLRGPVRHGSEIAPGELRLKDDSRIIQRRV